MGRGSALRESKTRGISMGRGGRESTETHSQRHLGSFFPTTLGNFLYSIRTLLFLSRVSKGMTTEKYLTEMFQIKDEPRPLGVRVSGPTPPPRPASFVLQTPSCIPLCWERGPDRVLLSLLCKSPTLVLLFHAQRTQVKATWKRRTIRY